MQAVKKTVVSQKSLMLSQQEKMFTFWLQIVCVVVRCEIIFFEGSVRPENEREVFGVVRGARLYNKNNARVCDCLAVRLGTNPTFSSFISIFSSFLFNWPAFPCLSKRIIACKTMRLMACLQEYLKKEVMGLG